MSGGWVAVVTTLDVVDGGGRQRTFSTRLWSSPVEGSPVSNKKIKDFN